MATTFYDVGDGKTHATIMAAINAIPGNLAGTGHHHVRVYSKAPNNEYVEHVNAFGGFSNASTVDYIEIEAMVPHLGLASGGIKIVDTGVSEAGMELAVYLFGYSRFHGFVLKGGAAARIASLQQIRCSSSGDGVCGCRVYDNIIYGWGSSGQAVVGIFINLGGGSKVYNNIIYNNYTYNVAKNVYGIWSFDDVGDEIYNNTVYNLYCTVDVNRGVGIATVMNVPTLLKNNIAVDCPGGCYSLGNNNITSHNMSSDGTADDWGGEGHIINAVAANQFVNTGVGTEDLHLKDGADAIAAGTDVSTLFDYDIDGETRNRWDMGADYYPWTPPELFVRRHNRAVGGASTFLFHRPTSGRGRSGL